jgi:hypothetical protein
MSDDYSDNSHHLQHGFTNSIHATSYDRIEMNIGHWYVDEFGNRTREITARDVNEEVQLRAPLDRDRRTKQVRTAAARLAQLAAI